MDSLESPFCSTSNCPGQIYEENENTQGQLKRRAIKILPQVSLIESLRQMVRRKGFRKLIRDSRNSPEHQNNNTSFMMTDMSDGSIWHELKTGIKREQGNLGHVRDVPRSEGSEKKLTDHRFGLHLTVNLDWFGAFSGRPHSTGPWYISINDLSRDVRFLQMWVICGGVTPGPTEPTTDQLVNVMEPTVREVTQLKEGIKMEIFDESNEDLITETVYADVNCTNCDTPGARKISGLAGHSSDLHCCAWCYCTLLEVNQQSGYIAENFVMRQDYDMLKQKFYSKDAPIPRQSTILKNHGVRFSAFDWIPGWRPSRQTALDFMHCIYLGVVAFFWTRVLFATHMFPGANGVNSAKQHFEDAINSIQWPSHITRFPKNLGENQSLKKADEWRRLLTVTPVLLWIASRNPDDTIPDTEPAVSPNERITTTHSRRRLSLYKAVLFLCVAVRLLATKKNSVDQANAGQTYFAHYCLALLALGVELTVNHHLAMHFSWMIKIYGPVYSWWLFAFERFNGLLEKMKNNGHDGGRVELTILRNWVQTHLLYEYLLALPDDASDYEQSLVDRIIKAEASKSRGSAMTEIAIFRSEISNDRISLPKRISKKSIDLHALNLHALGPNGEDVYTLLLRHCQTFWPELNLRRELSAEDGISFVGSRVARRVVYVRKDGLHYGAMSNKRTDSDTFAFIERNGVRIPVRLEDLLVIQIPESNQKPHVCAIVRRIGLTEGVPRMPWDLYATVLGIYTSFANDLGPLEIISASDIDCPLALIPVSHFMTQRNLWISVSFDHTGAEPEEDFDELD
ncbi:hypothetical protein BT96DRAFT_989625 [Gymnopus androsaceus JB14]|uniref:Uncharacterized protein n=1 Tax=Gymnopus androsaceus JB14 TaxID=1447944 RepID=A0A6A4I1A7_9AGAR|nr:hypothetical protein BT96DRAFT_989625 [Gymnopus androsaceus JB14]